MALINNGETGLSVRIKLNNDIDTPNFKNSYDTNGSLSVSSDFQPRKIGNIIYRLKQNHIVGTGGSDYIKALESIAAFSKCEVWIKFTGGDMNITLERKIITTTGTLSTITAGVSRLADFQRYKKLIPKFLLKSGTGAATTDVQIAIYNPKTMAETRVYVERWELDDATAFGDKPWYPPRLSTKYIDSIISHPFNSRFYLKGVSGTLNDADYVFEKTQAAYVTIKSMRIKSSHVNDRGYVVIPFTCDLANCLKITLNASSDASTIIDQFIIIKP